MPRSIWSGSISFGLVNIPVKLFSALSRKEIHFHQLHDADNVRIIQKRICPADGEEVSYDNLVKGYELTKDRYVVITKDELEALDPKASRTIDISEFVELSDIDPIYFDHPYYLVPASGAAKAYYLLNEAMNRSGKAALARVVIRNKQYLVVLRSHKRVLTMTTMLYYDEILDAREIEELAEDKFELDEDEVGLANQIIDSKTSEFDLAKYKDEHRQLVLDLIDRKSAGETIVTQPPVEEPGAKVIDLMSALEESLASIKKETDSKKSG